MDKKIIRTENINVFGKNNETKGIFISIKPKYLRLIETGKKTYEFRNYYPKEKIDVLYVYESSPTCMLKYVIELG